MSAMTDARDLDGTLARDANRRYWDSDASVNHIADELGLSKSSLYGLIEQLETGLACPDCHAELVFPNRTARDRGLVACPDCSFEGPAEEIMEAADPTRDEGEGGRSTGAPPLPSSRVLAGTALLGIAAGMLIASVVRRR